MIIRVGGEKRVILEGQAFEISNAWNDHQEWGGGWEDIADPYRPAKMILEVFDSHLFVAIEGEDGCVRADFSDISADDLSAILTPAQMDWVGAWLECEDAYALPTPPEAPSPFTHVRGILAEDAPQGKAIFVRLGGLPRFGAASRNHRDEEDEAGVSCFRGIRTNDGEVVVVLDNPALFATFMGLARPALVLEGEVVGTGSDGEPVLGSDSIEIVEMVR